MIFRCIRISRALPQDDLLEIDRHNAVVSEGATALCAVDFDHLGRADTDFLKMVHLYFGHL